MKTTIDIMDYVSSEEIKEAVLEAVQQKVACLGEQDIARIYTNSVYNAITQYTEELIAEKGMEFSVEEKVKEIISNLSAYTVFNNDVYERPNANMQLLNSIVTEEKGNIRKRVKEAIESAYNIKNAEDDIAQIMSDCVYDLFTPMNKTEVNR